MPPRRGRSRRSGRFPAMPTSAEDIVTIESLKRTPNPGVRWAELTTLFVLLPTVFWYWRLRPQPFLDLFAALGLSHPRLADPGRFMIPTLAAATFFCLGLLLIDRSFPRRTLWNFRAARPVLVPVLVRFVVLAALLTALTWQLQPGSALRAALGSVGPGAAWLGAGTELFSIPRHRPGLWLFIMVLYPVFSVWPQEVLYRAFFFHRYGRILPLPWLRVAMSGFVFGYMHIVFMNLLAPTLCVLGGLLFARTYERTRSVFAASFEHALYGCWVFTVGLGSYFYGGSYGGPIGP